jgi:multidrug efflux pump subunit AcrA (membrane-fusion protein)
MSEMDDPQLTEMVNNETPAGEMPQAQPAQGDDIEAIKAALKKANNEAAKYRKAAEAAEQERKAREDAELSETEKLRKQVAEYESRIKTAERQNLQRKIGAELGLPEVLALRLQGDDEDAMKEDAKAILATMPKKPSAPNLSATNPGNGQSPSETLAQQRQRVYGGGTDIFSPGEAAKLGGGVVFKDNAQ